MYQTRVLSTLVYDVKTCKVYKADERLHVYMMRHLPKMLNIKWWQHIQKKLILEKSKLPCMYDAITQQNLRRADHMNRLENRQQPRQILFNGKGHEKQVD